MMKKRIAMLLSIGSLIIFVTAVQGVLPTTLSLAAQATGTLPVSPTRPTVTPQPTSIYTPTQTATNTPFPLPAYETNTPTPILTATITPTPSGQVLIVNTLADGDDGSCDAKNCTLREAIVYAPWGETINFLPSLSGTLTLDDGLLLKQNVTINGPTANHVTISAPNSVVFEIYPSNTVAISNFIITTGPAGGFGVINHGGVVSIMNCTFQDIAGLLGSAIRNDRGKVSIANSTFSRNRSPGSGGVVANFDGEMNIVNSTFQGNVGAIMNYGTATITNSTFQGNNIEYDGNTSSTIMNGKTLTIKSTIIQGDANANNCSGQIVDAGHNLQYPGNDCGSTIPVNNPKLGPLQDNGGLTWTMAPLPGSPALDAINDAKECPKVDQRGAVLPSVIACDIGAFQHNGIFVSSSLEVTHTSIPTVTATNTPLSSGQVLVVNTLADGDDGACDAITCTLREAIVHGSWGATINFLPSLSGILTLNDGLLLKQNVTINGPTANYVTISALKSNAFEVYANTTIAISNFIITTGAGGGFALLNYGGVATVANSTFQDMIGPPGGILRNNHGSLTIINSTIIKNQSIGGGIVTNFEGILNVVNSTFQGNTGAIVNFGTATIAHSTFQGNNLNGYFSIANSKRGKSTIKASIIQGTANINNCGGQVIDGGHNLQYPGNDCGSSIPVKDPKLGPLQDNGGLTWTMALLPGSPALDAINDAKECPNADQRGAVLPSKTVCDIGAFQHRGVLP